MNNGFDLYVFAKGTTNNVIYENKTYVPRIGEHMTLEIDNKIIHSVVSDVEYVPHWNEVRVYVDETGSVNLN